MPQKLVKKMDRTHRTPIQRILLIDPKGFGSGLNLGLGYISAVLQKNNYFVRVVDLNNDPERLANGPKINLLSSSSEDWQKKVDRGLKFKPDLIGISINSFTLDNVVDIVKYCQEKMKSQEKRVIYVAGGPHISVYKNKFMEQFHNLFDFATVGESEETIIDLLKNINRPEKVKGILYYSKRQRSVIYTGERPPILDLDKLPFPNFESFDTISTKKGLYNYQLISSRGCPYKCVFCCQIWPKKWRGRSAKNVVEEIKYAQKKI